MSADDHFKKGKEYWELGEIKTAIEEFIKTLEINPEHHMARRYMSQIRAFYAKHKKETYADAKPSETTKVYWIHAKNKKNNYPKPTLKSGKWLIFVKKENVDEVWAKIKKATEEGKLGGSAKVSTAKQNPNAPNPEKKVICVYTYDWTDERDVKRIREELRKLGITNKIPYKADEDTLAGKYRVRGHKRISKYYE